ncbi:MAG: N-acetylmuramoyl-L-alanine amidase [Gemmatimonadaceae bacterium]
MKPFRCVPHFRRAAIVMIAAGCATTPAPTPPPVTPVAREEAPRPTFPPVPRVNGALDLRIVYPPAGALISARDSTFLFGSTGSGEARLQVNGFPVPVLPNGSWLAWLPLPPRERPVYDFVLMRGADTVRATHRIARPAARPALPESGRLVVDSGSVAPRGTLSMMPNDAVRVSVRAPGNAEVWLVAADGSRRPLRNGTADGTPGDAQLWGTDVPASMLFEAARLRVARGADTISLAAPRVTRADVAGPQLAIVGGDVGTPSDSDRVVVARPVAGGTYKWFLLPGTVVEISGRSGDSYRVRLDRDLDVWMNTNALTLLPEGTPRPRRVAGNARVRWRGLSAAAATPQGEAPGEWSDIVIPMAARAPYAVHETPTGLELVLYGVVVNTDIINYTTDDPFVRRVTWTQESAERGRFVVALHSPALGYLVRWERGAMVLRMRRAPVVDQRRPLAGLTIAVDAGHPPSGSTGPTGLYEAVATLAIAQRLETMLVQRGARVVMTRTSSSSVALEERPAIARRANAHAFVSIHLNALPDGVNPFVSHGTGTYYFNPGSESLAREVQRGMVRHLGLRDLGINYDNLAVLRPTWMPSILCEGAFIMLPEQEALLRTAEFQHAYALGVAEGLERFFLGLER